MLDKYSVCLTPTTTLHFTLWQMPNNFSCCLKTSGTVFLIRTSQPVNNIYVCLMIIYVNKNIENKNTENILGR